MQNFSVISVKFFRKISSIVVAVFLALILFVCFEIYVPINPNSRETITFTVQKGWGDGEIAANLKKLGAIRSEYFFKVYVVLSLKHASLKAGEYNLSAKMSAHQIANKIANGDVVKGSVRILEGWDVKDIGKYLDLEGICLAAPDPAKPDKQDFVALTRNDYSEEFDFLEDKPKDVDLEGYLFPDTYEISKGESCEDILNAMLVNFENKLTQELRDEILTQKKTIFDIVTMASLLEKEVRGLSDKKIASGILWKRLEIGMPLQLDATINYITGKSVPGVAIKDTKIDSPYNTYKYRGLPKGPISSPGIDSIIAAIYPKDTKYWYYLSDGITHFSETLDQHNEAKAKYLQ